jgi:heme/copper-type cytochrome/quinol oxidase subunit 2
LRRSEDEREDDSQEDVIRRQDGLVRYWMFFSGDQVQLFAALAAAFCGVLWCFLYVLGAGQGILRTFLLIVGGSCFLVWWLLVWQLGKYRERGWKKEPLLQERDKKLIPVAVSLWLFILLFFIGIITVQWMRHAH